MGAGVIHWLVDDVHRLVDEWGLGSSTGWWMNRVESCEMDLDASLASLSLGRA